MNRFPIILLVSIFALQIHSQEVHDYMVIEKKDNSTLKINVEDVKRIVFQTEKPVDPGDTIAKYMIHSDTINLGEYHLYADVFQPFIVKRRYYQANPNCTTPENRVQARLEELNKQLAATEKKVINDGVLFVRYNNSGLKVNGHPMPSIRINARFFNGGDADMITIDSLCTLWRQGVASGMFWDNSDNTVNIMVRVKADNYEIAFTNGIRDGAVSTRNDPQYFNYLKHGTQLRSNYVYLWNYDRFNDRIYEAENGDIYMTKITAKKLADLKGFDAKIPYENSYFDDIIKKRPVVQLYKNDELLMEAAAESYSEEWREEKDENTTSCIINFSFHTKMDNVVVFGCYEWTGFSRFSIEKVDYSKPTSDANFTMVSKESIRIVKDYKIGGKGSGSTDDGKGNITSYNVGD